MAENTDICPVCREEKELNTGIDSCIHRYCFSCIYECSKRTTTCPMCRAIFQQFIVGALPDERVLYIPPSYEEHKRLFHIAVRKAIVDYGDQPWIPYIHQDLISCVGRYKPASVEFRSRMYFERIYVTSFLPSSREPDIIDMRVNLEACYTRLIPFILRELNAIGIIHGIKRITYDILRNILEVGIQNWRFMTFTQEWPFDLKLQFTYELYHFARSGLVIHQYDQYARYRVRRRLQGDHFKVTRFYYRHYGRPYGLRRLTDNEDVCIVLDALLHEERVASEAQNRVTDNDYMIDGVKVNLTQMESDILAGRRQSWLSSAQDKIDRLRLPEDEELVRRLNARFFGEDP